MRNALSPFKKKAAPTADVSLNITSMADIFTIILVFLLKSFATGAANISPTAGVQLPEAEAEAVAHEALKLEIAQNAILLEGKPVVQLKNFDFDRRDILKNGSSKALNNKLGRERQRQKLISKNNKDVKLDSKVIVIADQRAPYVSIRRVLASAAVNGYTDFKLAVVTGD